MMKQETALNSTSTIDEQHAAWMEYVRRAREDDGVIDGLAPVTAQDLDDLERQCLGVIQAIRRIRGKPPLVTPNQQRKAVRGPRE